MSLQYSEYNPINNDTNKNPQPKRGVTRKRRCKIQTNKIQNLLKSVEGMGDESSLADFNPPPKPELTKIKNENKESPKSEEDTTYQPKISDDSDSSDDSDYYPPSDEEEDEKEFKLRAFQQFVGKMFPSRANDERLENLDKLDQLQEDAQTCQRQ